MREAVGPASHQHPHQKATHTMSPASQRLVAAKVAERIRLARSLAGMTQEDVARALDVTVRTYARWERAETQGFLGDLKRIAKVLGTTPEELRGPEEVSPAADDADVVALRREVRELRALVERVLVAVKG
jgi:transcriptional regulator with XRE-family HTH domain